MPNELIPDGYSSVAPWIISKDTRQLIDFAKHAFDAEELGIMEGPDGKIVHAEMRIGDAVILMFDTPDGWPETPAFIRLYLPDAEAAYGKAVNAGGTAITEVTDLAFGDRVGRVRDPLGNIWWLQQHTEDVSEEETQRRWTDPRWARGMDYVQATLVEALGT